MRKNIGLPAHRRRHRAVRELCQGGAGMMGRRNFLAAAAALGTSALLGGCSAGERGAGAAETDAPTGSAEEEETVTSARTMTVTCGNAVVTYELNDSPAADALLDQLPLTLEVDDFSDNEKVFYPPEELDVTDALRAESGEAGTLAYYASWGDVVMFYGSFSPNDALYELGWAVDGEERISELSGTTEVAL